MRMLRCISYSVVAILLVQGGASAYGFGDLIGHEYPPTAVHIEQASALPTTATYSEKYQKFVDAINDNDFHRVITLFSECANLGDAMCQFFLADGVSEWLMRGTVPQEEKYGPAFVREWLRRSVSKAPIGCSKSETFCLDPYVFVAMNWWAYYMDGVMGFPKDGELSYCWREVFNSSNGLSRDAISGRAKACRELESVKYGKEAKWLVR